MKVRLTQELGRKILAVVDAGLVSGLGYPEPGHTCVEGAVCIALGLPHSDDPECVAVSLRRFKIRLNDSAWSSNAARAAGLRRLAVAQVASLGKLDDVEFVRRLAEATIREIVPAALRAAGLEAAAKRCEEEGMEPAARAAAAYAYAAAYAARAAARAADAAADAAAYAAAYAARAADAAADAAARAAAACADAADAAACAADAAAYAADAADARDRILTLAADIGLRTLRQMKAPGVALLDKLIGGDLK